MAAKISNNREWLEGVFREILSVPCTEDAVVFETDNLRSETITIDKKYPGIRFLITAQMDTIEHRMTIDVGFGDVVTPHPETIDFPLLLEDNTGFKLQSYTVESVIAEKFHTMIDRDVVNSRMKDFFDCYILLTSQHKTEDRLLRDAIYATFNNRNLKYNADLQLFTTSFSADELRLKRWSTFLKKIKWKEEIPFHEVMKVISDKLLPIYNDYWSDRNEV